ncbi:hypothetical protein M413DRAFT_447168 [Hebeloma cylindrosporum]|uniref:Uncharacterized protein n=1 Tax=Hebeloma cylindrosporum TaxID=76867 RepID=A0A0C3C6J5_HEBCY|nr:hypothetical protein M413DRAFT_447168 [Hebeloma cylindrosporum h7]
MWPVRLTRPRKRPDRKAGNQATGGSIETKGGHLREPAKESYAEEWGHGYPE